LYTRLPFQLPPHAFVEPIRAKDPNRGTGNKDPVAPAHFLPLQTAIAATVAVRDQPLDHELLDPVAVQSVG
jgi:hypothetical protein